MPFRVWAETHNGARRTHNEDAWLSRPELGLWLVADGAGGHDSGDLASGMLAAAMAEIPAELPPDQLLAELRARVAGVHDALKQEAARRGAESVIASTVVILVVRGLHFACLWAGDSRAYLMRGGVLQQVTRDHSLVQELIDAGMLTEAQAEGHPQANVITRAVGGGDETLELDKMSGRLAPGDRFLLCSDGLCKTLDEATLAVLTAAEAPTGAAVELIAAALERNATDNITAVVVEVAPEPEADSLPRVKPRLPPGYDESDPDATLH